MVGRRRRDAIENHFFCSVLTRVCVRVCVCIAHTNIDCAADSMPRDDVRCSAVRIYVYEMRMKYL